MTPSNFKNLLIEFPNPGGTPGVALVKFNRPAVLNALNTDMLREMSQAFEQLQADPAVRVIVLTGEGKAFIAGADIAEMKDKSTAEARVFAELGQTATKFLEIGAKPTIAAVNGYALGGGCEFAIACDFIYASDKAVMGQPEVTLGIITGFGGAVRLPKFVGLPRAKELLLSGRMLKAEECLAYGLVNKVVPHEQLMSEVLDLAAKISRNSATAVQQLKRVVNDVTERVGLVQKLGAEAQAFSEGFGTHDQREGMGAFVEKRKPKFQGLS